MISKGITRNLNPRGKILVSIQQVGTKMSRNISKTLSTIPVFSKIDTSHFILDNVHKNCWEKWTNISE